MRRRRVVTAAAVGVVVLGVLGAALVLAGGGGPTGGPASAVAVPHGQVPHGQVPHGQVPGAADVAGGAERRAGSSPGSDAGSNTGSNIEAAPVPPPAGDALPLDPFPPDGPLPGPVPGTAGRDLVRTAQLTLEVADPAAATRTVRTVVAAAGGVVAEEQLDPSGSWLSVRVPVAGLDRLVDDLAATGTVLARSARTEDATAQIVDLDGRLATQQASVTRVRALLAQATAIGEVVTVEAELARREADLESLQRRLAALRDRAALSTLAVELRRAPVVTPADAPPTGFRAGLGAGWAGVVVVGTALATAAGFLLPFLPALVIATLAGWAVVRRRRRTAAERGGPGPEGGV
jgi:hypothetical protein